MGTVTIGQPASFVPAEPKDGAHGSPPGKMTLPAENMEISLATRFGTGMLLEKPGHKMPQGAGSEPGQGWGPAAPSPPHGARGPAPPQAPAPAPRSRPRVVSGLIDSSPGQAGARHRHHSVASPGGNGRPGLGSTHGARLIDSTPA